MKILNIKFNNINNLKGENEISFEDEPLHSAGIFAITGPTGAGKSTLLDVITLALFNKIPRFKGTISKNSIEGLGSVMTHHTNEASASITYEIHNQKYTSAWTVGRTKTGNLKDYEMYIYDANGTPMDLKKSEVPAKNEDIIGLKYDQFVKSIILSQGQFSKFLKADKSERGQLLENLTGASIYRKISIAAYDKFKTVKDEVALEKDRLEHIQVLKDEERAGITEQIKIDTKNKEEHDKTLEKYNLASQVKSDVERMSEALHSKKLENENMKKEKEDYRDKLHRLDKLEKLSPILGDLARYLDAKSSQEKLTKNIDNNKKLIADSEVLRSSVIKEMSNLIGKPVTAENFRSEMSLFEKEVNALIQNIQHVQASGSEARERIKIKVANHRIEINPKADPELVIPNLVQRLNDVQSIIEKAGLKSDVEIAEVEKSKTKTTEELAALNDLNHAYEDEMTSRKRKEKATEEFASYSEQVKKYSPLVETTYKLLTATKENIALLEKQKQDALLIAKLTDHRNELVDGEPCPLCGALDHPYTDHAPKSESDLDVKVQNAKSDLQKQENDYAAYNKELTENQAQQKLIEEQLKLHDKELENAMKDKSVKYQAYVGTEPNDEAQIGVSIERLESKVEQLSQAVVALRSRTVLSELINDFKEIHEISVRYKELAGTLKKKYSGNDVSKDCNALQDRFVSATTRIATLKTVLENDTSDLLQTRTYLDAAAEKLNPQIKSLGFESIEETTAFMISEDELNALKSKKEELVQKSVAIETEMKTLVKNIAERKTQDVLPEIKLSDVKQTIATKSSEREALIKSIGEKTATLQKDDLERERTKSKESELKKLQEKLDKWSLLNKLIGERTGNKFANFAQGLTLQNLLVYANKRLQKLSDRYLLDKPIKDGALTVIDQYQGNIQRSVSTLSGGESFLISLALALSLSDMASKNVNLESLFIDEGFGTLDQESLNIAMNTLERLQTESQKTVGVISHVEALKERIHVQIKLDKNAQGYGTIKIVG